MTEDQQEAESLRYSNEAFFVLPLESGRIAVLSPRRDLWGIASTFEEACSLARACYKQWKPRESPVTKGRVVPNINLKDFGL